MKKTLCIFETDKHRSSNESLKVLRSLGDFSDFLVLAAESETDLERPTQLRGTRVRTFRVIRFSEKNNHPTTFTGVRRLFEWLIEQDYGKVLRLRLDGLPLNANLVRKFWRQYQESASPYGCTLTWNAFLPGLLIDAWDASAMWKYVLSDIALFPDGHLHFPGNTFEYELDLEDRSFYFQGHFDNLFSMPHTLQIELSSVCNSRCPKCLFHGGLSPLYNPKSSTPPFMDDALFKKIIDEFSTYQPRTGLAAALNYRGESLLHPRFFDLLNYTRKKGVRAVFNTNGKLFNKETIHKLLDLDVTAISLSIDSLRPKLHKQIQRGNIDEILRNLDFLIETKERRGLKRPVLSSISVVSSENVDELVSLLDSLLKRVELVSYFGYMDIQKRTISAPHTYFDINKRYPCPIPWEIITILSSGKVIRCGYDYNHENIFGDLNKSSIFDIWNSAHMCHDRAYMMRGMDEKVKICSECPRWRAVYKKFSLVDGIMVTTQWEGKTLQVLDENYDQETLRGICSDLPRTVSLTNMASC